MKNIIWKRIARDKMIRRYRNISPNCPLRNTEKLIKLLIVNNQLL